MRRMILEVYGKDLGSVMGKTVSEKVNSLELLHFLKFDRKEIAAVGRVGFKGANSNPKGVFDASDHVRVQLLGRDEGGFSEILIKWRPKRGSLLSDHIERGDGYIVSPFGFHEGRFKIAFLGNQKQIQKFLGRIEEHRLSYRVVSVMDASFSPDSPLGSLTEKQRNVLVSAYRLGYYDVPRKLDSDQLANKLNLVNSTVVEHIRKAEKRMLAEMLGESWSR